MKFYQYLVKNNLLNSSPEAIEAAKIAFRKLSNKAAVQKHRTHKKRVELLLEKQEYMQLKALAKNHHLSLAAFIRLSTWAYNESTFIVPNPKALQKMVIEIKRATNLLNQTIRYVHYQKSLEATSIEAMQQSVLGMEKAVIDLIEAPKIHFRPKDFIKNIDQ